MPNGVSCACFAIRNHKIAESTNNVFRRGIAGIQTVRTVDAAAKASVIQQSALKPALPYLSKAAAFLRKLVYPLIIASGVYNTAKSDDKVRTGFSQAAGIGAMYGCEKVAEKGLKHIDKKIENLKGNKYFKAIKIAWYVAKGLLYLGASLGGYEGGSKLVEKIIDKIRGTKPSEEKKKDSFDEINNNIPPSHVSNVFKEIV